MRFSLPLLCALLAMPNAALAATAADVFSAAYETPLPLQYTFESHREGGGMSATLRASGMQEGRGTEWYKQRTDVSLFSEQGSDSMALHIKVTVFGDTMYLRVAGADVVKGGKKTHMDATPWTMMPLHGTPFDRGMFPFLDLLKALDMDATGAADMWAAFRSHTEDMTVTSERFRGGTAYSMSADGSATMRARFNTDTNGRFLYGKVYHAQPGFSLTGETQPYGKGVVVEVPKETVQPQSVKKMLEEHGIFVMLAQMPSVATGDWETEETKKSTPVRNDRARPAIAGRPVYKPMPQPECLQTGYTWASCGMRYSKREIHQGDDIHSLERGWKQRVGDDRIIDAYDAVARRFETVARKGDMHEAKTMLSNFTIRSSGSDDTDTWLTEDILPFFHPTETAMTNQTVFLEDEQGYRGVAIEKMTKTASGRRRYFVITLLLERNGAQPVVADVFVNATLRDLKGKGWID